MAKRVLQNYTYLSQNAKSSRSQRRDVGPVNGGHLTALSRYFSFCQAVKYELDTTEGSGIS